MQHRNCSRQSQLWNYVEQKSKNRFHWKGRGPGGCVFRIANPSPYITFTFTFVRSKPQSGQAGQTVMVFRSESRFKILESRPIIGIWASDPIIGKSGSARFHHLDSKLWPEKVSDLVSSEAWITYIFEKWTIQLSPPCQTSQLYFIPVTKNSLFELCLDH